MNDYQHDYDRMLSELAPSRHNPLYAGFVRLLMARYDLLKELSVEAASGDDAQALRFAARGISALLRDLTEQTVVTELSDGGYN